MSDCAVCDQRTADFLGDYCCFACYAMTEAGIAEVDTRHVLKAAQVTARTAALAAEDTTGVSASAMTELNALAADDDGQDR